MEESDPLVAFGLDPLWQRRFDALAESSASELGRVIRQDRGFVLVATRRSTQLAALRPGKSGYVLVGDWVAVRHEAIVEVLERESLLGRRDAHTMTEQPVVANVDVVFVVCGVDRPVKMGRIERAVTQTWQSGATPVVVLSKIDLASDAAEVIADVSGSLNVDVITVSSRSGEGLADIRARMRAKTSVLIGESGAGKSTLLNALLGDELVATGEVRAGDSKGRHTTTRRELHVTPHGILIDTPGVRSLGVWADEESVATTFSDVVDLAEQCRFNDCAHESEPGCAVNDAVAAGELDERRVEAWRMQMREIAANELRMNEHEKRKNERRFGRVVDEALRMKGRK